MTIRCAVCAADNPQTSRFCGSCGSALGARCPACSAPVVQGFRFCGSCGVALPATDSVSPATADHVAGEPVSLRQGDGGNGGRVAERRLVSILFADLVSFTALSDGRDPEEVQELLTRYFDVCRAVIGRYGGAIEKFIGDAVMAMWGAPVAHEDDAERAVRAAVDLVAAVATLGQELALPRLAARAGVVSGEAAITVGAVGQGMVAGDVVNTASRLETAARPGTVLVDEATYRAVRGSVEFERAGDRTLRGKRMPLPAWEARQVVALRGGEGRSVLPEGPLIGRESAVAIVKDLLNAVREERSARLVSIFGQAGVGKGRVAWELEKYVDGVVEKIHWHLARSPAYGEGLAFWALAEMVRSRARITEGDGQAVARRRLASCLAQFVPDDKERRWVAPHLAALIGIGPAPGGERAETFAAWRTFFERVADRATTVLVFDDLHWADAGTLDFIEYLVAGAAGRPILVVTLARPSLLESRPGWGADRRTYVGLHLEPLPRAAMAELLGGLAPGLPPDVAERILDRAEGIPLYAVEILRMLVDRGDLEAVGGVYVVRRELEQLAVPETLQALVAARLDELEPTDRTLIRDAAVLGRDFRPAAVAAVGRTSVEAIEPHLHHLVEREFLIQDTDERALGRERYRFGELLVRDVAYGTLSLRDRRERHLAAAAYFAALDDPELAGVVANHVLAAYRSGPAGRPDHALAVQAVAALRAAADRASALHAHDIALGFREEALSVTDDPAEIAAIRLEAAGTAQSLAHLDDAEAHARAALAWYRERDDRPGIARASSRLGAIQVVRYEPDAIDTMMTAIAEIGLDGGDVDPVLADDPAVVGLLAGLARAYVVNGHQADAIIWADRALASAERLGLTQVTADALAGKGAALIEEGRTTEGVALLRACLTLAEENGLTVAALRARNGLAVGLMVDDPRDAMNVARAGVDTARRVGFLDLAVRIASNWAEGALEAGHWDEVVTLLGELEQYELPVMDAVDFGGVLGLIATWRGDPGAAERFERLEEMTAAQSDSLVLGTLRYRTSAAKLGRGLIPEALADATTAATCLAGFGYRTAVREGSGTAGRAALRAGDLAVLDDAIQQLEASGLRGRWMTAMIATFRAGSAALHGADERATDGYRDAADAWRRLDLPLQLGLCQLEAAWLLPPGSDVAESARDEARTVLTGLGAAELLDRLEHGLSRPATPVDSAAGTGRRALAADRV
jgi:class 3 adenylate cyclase